MSSTKKQGFMFAAMAVLIWTGFIIVSRLGGVSPLLTFDIVAIRYFSCAAILLPIWWFKYRFSLLNWRLLVISLMGGIAYTLLAFRGFEDAPASHGALLLPGLMPFFIIALSATVYRETIEAEKYLGVTLICIGVGVGLSQTLAVAGSGFGGDLYFVAAAFCWGLFSVLLKHWQISAWQATVSLALISCAVYLPIYLLFLPKTISLSTLSQYSDDILLQAFYQGVLATIVQMMFYVRAVQLIGPAAMGSMMAWVPVTAGFSAILFLDEPVSIELIAGLVLVSFGACIAQSNFLQRYYSKRTYQ